MLIDESIALANNSEIISKQYLSNLSFDFRVTTPSSTQSLTSPGRLGGPIERLLIEIALSVFIVLAHFAVDSPRSLPPTISSKASAVLAAAYTAATLVFVSLI